MSIEQPDRTEFRRAVRPIGPASFDVREIELSSAIRRHVLLRDACLTPAGLISEKLDLLDHHPWETAAPFAGGRGSDDLTERVSVVAQMTCIRRRIRDTGSLLTCERRRLVLLDAIAATPTTPAPGLTWSKSPVDLVAEAAAGIGYDAGDVRRIARRLDIARHVMPPVEIGPSTTRALAESLGRVMDLTPGAAVASSVLLLSDQVPHAWTPSACGASLLDPGPGGSVRFLGTLVARHDLAAFVDDLATLRVAADISPTIRRYAEVMLPELAHDLGVHPTTAEEGEVIRIAAELALRTAGLLRRGFRRYDRPGRTPRFVVA